MKFPGRLLEGYRAEAGSEGGGNVDRQACYRIGANACWGSEMHERVGGPLQLLGHKQEFGRLGRASPAKFDLQQRRITPC